MNEEKIKRKVEKFGSELTSSIQEEIGSYLESLTLTGSFVVGDISTERPDINMILFFKEQVPGDAYLQLGRIFYDLAESYAEFFSVRADMLPFRFAPPVGGKDLELSVTPLLLNMANKDMEPSFGIAPQVLQGMKETRKVVYGSDVLGEMEFDVGRKDIINGILEDMPLYNIQLQRAPLTYDIEENYDLLATESLEIGKVALYMDMELFIEESKIQQGEHLSLMKKKENLKKFYEEIDSELTESARTILDARLNFLSVKKDKEKCFELYRASYKIVNSVLGKAFELKGKVD